jgi:hypothetical protein
MLMQACRAQFFLARLEKAALSPQIIRLTKQVGHQQSTIVRPCLTAVI